MDETPGLYFEHIMKRWYAVGILTALALTIVLMSGCISVDSMGPAPVEVSTPQTPVPELITAPVPAAIPIVSPTILVKTVTAAKPMPTTVSVSTTSDHISKYADYNPVLSLPHTGIVNIVTGGWGTGAAIYVNSTESSNTAMIVNVTPDGSSIGLSLAPGNYTATLPDKNDNLSEQHYFFVGENAITYVPFNGYTYRVSNGEGC
jgi:hypothetical protein